MEPRLRWSIKKSQALNTAVEDVMRCMRSQSNDERVTKHAAKAIANAEHVSHRVSSPVSAGAKRTALAGLVDVSPLDDESQAAHERADDTGTHLF